MADQLISAASAGNQQNVGRATVINAAQSIVLQGWQSLYISYPLALDASIIGGLLSFNLSTARQDSNAASVRFDFGVGTRPITVVSASDTSLFGALGVVNSAQACVAQGFNSNQFASSPALIFLGQYTLTHFNHTQTLPETNALNVPFYFGGTALISAVSLGDQLVFGAIEKIKQPANIIPLSVQVGARYGNVIAYSAGRAGGLNFNLTSSVLPVNAKSVRFDFGVGARLVTAVGGIDDAQLGAPSVVNTAQGVIAEGGLQQKFGQTIAYRPTIAVDVVNGGKLNFTFLENVKQTNALNVPFYFTGAKSINLAGWISELFGSVSVSPQFLRPGGFNALGLGSPTILPPALNLPLTGFSALSFGTAVLSSTEQALTVMGFVATTFGATTSFNLRQYITKTGWDSQAFGTTYLKGGVKTVLANGVVSLAFGLISVINTKADQTAAPSGIAAPLLGTVSVSPRILFAVGIQGWSLGTALVQFSPHPIGFQSDAYGTPSIEYKTKHLGVSGINSYSTGYSTVFDPTQTIFAIPPDQTTVFGDMLVKNKNFFIRPLGVDGFESSGFAVVYSNRRHVSVADWDSLSVGDLAIHNKTPSIAPQGFETLVGPSALVVGHSQRTVSIVGISTPFPQFGTGVVTKIPQLSPSGFAGAAGQPTVWFSVRTFEISGEDVSVYGEPTVWFRYRYVAVNGGIQGEACGTPTIDFTRKVLLQSGSNMLAIGNTAIANKNRALYPTGAYKDFASNHMVGGLRFLRSIGWDSATYLTRIIPPIQNAYPLGFEGSYGLASVSNFTQIMVATGFQSEREQPAGRWGQACIYNLTQIITQFFDGENGLVPPAWSQWTLIENRNFNLRIFGNVMSRVAEPVIAHNARLIQFDGIAAPTFNGADLVAYRVRHFQLDGIAAPYISGWDVVYNDARVIFAVGQDVSGFGVAEIVKTRRYYTTTAYDQSIYGTPMIDFAIRTLTMNSFYAIQPPSIALPEVKLHTRYIEVQGLDTFRSGGAHLHIHFNIIAPRWAMRDVYGEPFVRNVTPELHAYGHNSEEYGHTTVRLQWRPVNPFGADTSMVFGRAEIAYRDRIRFLTGFNAGIVSDKLKIIKSGAPPYSLQTIDVDSKGIPLPEGEANSQLGRPIVNQQVIYVQQLLHSSAFGVAFITANTIRVEPGYQELLVGRPLVGLKIRTIKVSGWKSSVEPSKARVSPHTIWAVVEAPGQAQENHESRDLHFVNSDSGNRPAGEVFGLTKIELQHRKITAIGGSDSVYGVPALTSTRQYITPEGIRSFRFGWHSLPIELTIDQYESADSMYFGQTSIGRSQYLGTQKITPDGLAYYQSGLQFVELKDRTIRPSGYSTLIMGASVSDDTPYMWQGLRVGPRVPIVVSGTDLSMFGLTWISNRVRELAVTGFESHANEYQLEAFDRRMRVTRRNIPRVPRLIAPIGGISSFISGTPNVRLGIHYIRPDGNADQYRKGAF